MTRPDSADAFAYGHTTTGRITATPYAPYLRIMAETQAGLWTRRGKSRWPAFAGNLDYRKTEERISGLDSVWLDETVCDLSDIQPFSAIDLGRSWHSIWADQRRCQALRDHERKLAQRPVLSNALDFL